MTIEGHRPSGAKNSIKQNNVQEGQALLAIYLQKKEIYFLDIWQKEKNNLK